MKLYGVVGSVVVAMSISLLAPPASDPAVKAIYNSFGSGSLGAKALRVAKCESNLNPKAVSGSGAQGLFQLMPFVWRAYGAGSPLHAGDNAATAHRIYLKKGWAFWGTGRDGCGLA